jgi:hypothetical protein
MPNIPTPIRAALGLAATAVDEVRKLPETLPQAATTVPLRAVSTAMQASMKLQQHLATLAARGDEVLSQLRGGSAEPPSWATFDESPVDGAASVAADPQAGKAAFDLIDYDNTGFAEGSDDEEGKGRWDAVGVGGTEAAAGDDLRDVTATPPSAAGPTPPPAGLAEAVSAPALPSAAQAPAARTTARSGPAKRSAATTGPAKAGAARSGPAKTSPAKAARVAKKTTTEPAMTEPAKTPPAKAGAAKAAPLKAPAKTAPAKAAPAKAAKRGGRKEPDHEPLEVAARKAKPAAAPNPSTMAAEILHAHEAATDDE